MSGHDMIRWMARARSWFAPLLLVLAWLPNAEAQNNPKVIRIDIKHVGPPSVSDALIRANIRVKVGDEYKPAAVDDDVRNLYATGLFFNIQVTADKEPGGLVLGYVVQGNPRLTDIHFVGNKKMSTSKLNKTITAKAGEPFNERKLFTDSQEIQKLYQKKGYPRTTVEYKYTVDEASGRATATFNINEALKVKISDVEFVGAQAFTQKKLRHEIKTRRHWWMSWLTGHGFLKDEQFTEDKETLADFYRDHGYLDFEIKDVQFQNPTPRTMIIRIVVYEGAQYKVGAVRFTGNKLFSNADLGKGLKAMHQTKGGKAKVGPNGLPMDVGDVFTPKGLTKDIEAVSDFYGAKGYVDVATGHGLEVKRIPNTETGTMDLEFNFEEGQKAYIEKVEIRGNTKTKDRVIRRELSVSPGEVFDMVRVKRSKRRLEEMQYFQKVDARPEPTEVPNRKNLIIGVDEASTGRMTLGAGFSSVDALVGYAELSQGNFDLFHPPTFTGGGQKLRLHLALGTEQQQYTLSYEYPWFLGLKMTLGVDLYYRELDYLSVNNIYTETIAGTTLTLRRALRGDYLIGAMHYTIEDIGIDLNSDYNALNTPPSILKEVGHSLLSRVGGSLAFDTRQGLKLPDAGQRTELAAEFTGGPLGGDREYYKLDLTTAWYFKGLAKGHVIEVGGHAGAAQGVDGGEVPFYGRYYLGGLWDLRGFKYHHISPRDFNPVTGTYFDEPVGGDSFWSASVEYSIPIFEQEGGVGVRFAVFYDAGAVIGKPYRLTDTTFFNDNWGIGLRLNLPIGPIRLDYGIPIRHDQFNEGSGQFQFGVGYTREFR
jgi:outer membrane protein insertion porin family